MYSQRKGKGDGKSMIFEDFFDTFVKDRGSQTRQRPSDSVTISKKKKKIITGCPDNYSFTRFTKIDGEPAIICEKSEKITSEESMSNWKGFVRKDYYKALKWILYQILDYI